MLSSSFRPRDSGSWLIRLFPDSTSPPSPSPSAARLLPPPPLPCTKSLHRMTALAHRRRVALHSPSEPQRSSPARTAPHHPPLPPRSDPPAHPPPPLCSSRACPAPRPAPRTARTPLPYHLPHRLPAPLPHTASPAPLPRTVSPTPRYPHGRRRTTPPHRRRRAQFPDSASGRDAAVAGLICSAIALPVSAAAWGAHTLAAEADGVRPALRRPRLLGSQCALSFTPPLPSLPLSRAKTWGGPWGSVIGESSLTPSWGVVIKFYPVRLPLLASRSCGGLPA